MATDYKFLLDSDVLINIYRNRTKIRASVSSLVKKTQPCISVINVLEIYKNCFPEEESTTQKFLSGHKMIDVNFPIAKLAGEYWKKYKNVHVNIADYIIAATCKINHLTLVTGNSKHYPMKDIKVIDPLQEKLKSIYDYYRKKD